MLAQSHAVSERSPKRASDRQTLTGTASVGADYSFEFCRLQNKLTEEMLVNVTSMFMRSRWLSGGRMCEERSAVSVLHCEISWCLVPCILKI